MITHFRRIGRIRDAFAPGELDRYAGLLPGELDIPAGYREMDPVMRARGLGRCIWMHAVPYCVPTRIEPPDADAFTEWFARNALRMPDGPKPGFWLRHKAHGGVRVGTVHTLINQPTWCDAVALIDDSPAGDAFLQDVGADGGHLPVSIAFEKVPGHSVPYYGAGVVDYERTRAILREIAVVDTAAYQGAYTYSRGDLTALASMQAAAKDAAA